MFYFSYQKPPFRYFYSGEESHRHSCCKILHPMGIIFHLVNKQAVHPLLPWVFKFQTIPNSSHILFLL